MPEIGIYLALCKLLDTPRNSVTISANLGGEKKIRFDFCYPTDDKNLIVIVRNVF